MMDTAGEVGVLLFIIFFFIDLWILGAGKIKEIKSPVAKPKSKSTLDYLYRAFVFISLIILGLYLVMSYFLK